MSGVEYFMSIQFSCPQCGKQYKVDDRLAGKSAPCKQCGQKMRIPAPAAAASDEPDLSALLPAEGAVNEDAPMPEPAATSRSEQRDPAGKSFKMPAINRQIVLIGVFAVMLVILLIWRPWNQMGQEKSDGSLYVGHYPNDTRFEEKCKANLQRIGAVLKKYAEANNGKFPPDLATLLKDRASGGSSLSATDFLCIVNQGKTAPDSVGADALNWITKSGDYAYIGGATMGASPPKIVVYERWHRDQDELLHLLDTSLQIHEEAMPAAKKTIEAMGGGK
jgi:hypothetical protein